jgi:hypothetical protein
LTPANIIGSPRSLALVLQALTDNIVYCRQLLTNKLRQLQPTPIAWPKLLWLPLVLLHTLPA